MWSEGAIGIPAPRVKKPTIVHYWVNASPEPSEYGINNGRISNLILRINNKTVASYDHGWDMYPKDEAAGIATAILLMEHDGGEC